MDKDQRPTQNLSVMNWANKATIKFNAQGQFSYLAKTFAKVFILNNSRNFAKNVRHNYQLSFPNKNDFSKIF